MPDSEQERRPLQKRWLVLGGVIVLALVFLIPFIREGGARVDTSVEVETERAFTGDIRETAEGQGEIMRAASETVTAEYAGRFAMLAVQNGDLVEEGDLLALYDTDELNVQIDGILTEIDELDTQIAQSDQSSTYELRAETAGLVKSVNAHRGDLTGEDVLVTLSTDGLLRVEFALKPGAALPEEGDVLVTMDGGQTEGTVSSADEETGKYTVTFADASDYLPGSAAIITDREGNELGRGSVEINAPLEVTAEESGIVSQVAVQPGDTVEEGDLLVTCIDAALNEEYLALLDQRAERIDALFALQRFKEEPQLLAESRGIVAGLDFQPGDSIRAGQKLCRLVATDTFTVRIDVPESAAERIEPELPVELVFTDRPGTVYQGRVERLYEQGQFKYGERVRGVLVRLEDAEGLEIGMEAAEAAVILASAENAVLVPQRAVETGEDGTETVTLYYGDGLNRTHTVETGLRDGTYVQILRGVEPGESVVVSSHVVETTVYSFFSFEWVVGQEEGPTEDGLVSETD